VCVDGQGGVYFAGHGVAAGGSFDCLLMKYNIYGEYDWLRSWDGGDDDVLYSAAIGSGRLALRRGRDEQLPRQRGLSATAVVLPSRTDSWPGRGSGAHRAAIVQQRTQFERWRAVSRRYL